MKEIIQAFGFEEKLAIIEKYGTGLINSTWTINYENEKYILQKVNTNVFQQPELIAENLITLYSFFKTKFPNHLFTAPLRTLSGEYLYKTVSKDYYRLFAFVENSKAIDVVQNSNQAINASAAFGKFTHLLSEFDSSTLNISIPNFHNLSLRYEQFETSILNSSLERKIQSKEAIDYLISQKDIVNIFEQIKYNSNFELRVTHHDTKISNVLFDKNDECLCVIDLDTVMPGYFFSDVGDMMRTYLSPANEEENDFNKIIVREDYFKSIVEGYLNEMRNDLSSDELNHFAYAGEFMIYMQALRFLSDYLNNDIYYGAKYENHNFIRATNQINLLQKFQSKKETFNSLIKSFLSNQ